MNIEYCGLGKVIRQGKKRFAKLPASTTNGIGNTPLTAIRFPSMALYVRPKDAFTVLKKIASLSQHPTIEATRYLRLVVDSMFETRLVRCKPLEIPYFLSTDFAGRIGCLKIAQGPAVLALYPPDDIIKVLKILCLDFGKIIFHDKRDFEMSLSIERIKNCR
jgi:hypothetical protein